MEKQIRQFENILATQGPAHAYLFYGPQNVGKMSFARWLSEKLNGTRFEEQSDIIHLSPLKSDNLSSISIDDIRKVKSDIYRTPIRGPYKIVLIEDAHTMTHEAANAFLKILEEPPAFAVIILITEKVGFMQDTVVSRCQKVAFVEDDDCSLSNLADKYPLTDKQKSVLYAVAGLRYRWLEDVLVHNRQQQIIDSINIFKKLLASSPAERILLSNKIAETYEDKLAQEVQNWMYWARSQDAKDLSKKALVLRQLLALYDTVNQSQFNKRIALELFSLKL